MRLTQRSAGLYISERAMGFEPTTSSLGSWHSTTELRPQNQSFALKDLRLSAANLVHPFVHSETATGNHRKHLSRPEQAQTRWPSRRPGGPRVVARHNGAREVR